VVRDCDGRPRAGRRPARPPLACDTLYGGARVRWRPDAHAEVWLFGHALMEKLVAPRKAITAHTRVLFAPGAWFGLAMDHERRAWIDMQVARPAVRRGPEHAAFTPLPVLGVPGWWPDQDEAFYLDDTVFRPKRVGCKISNSSPTSNSQGAAKHDCMWFAGAYSAPARSPRPSPTH
jgi:hypothetical protein